MSSAINELHLWEFIYQYAKANEPVILLLVVESKGSSPGRQGFKMAVTKNELKGSIGGGIMEHKFVELAKEKLAEQQVESKVRKQFHHKSAADHQSGMICSGEQTVLLYRIQEKDIDAISKLKTSLQIFQNGTLIINPDGIDFSSQVPVNDLAFEMHSESDWQYKEKTGFKNQLHIIGGGHCSLALSKIMSAMDFYIHLYEERKALNTMQANNYVHQKHFVDDYSKLDLLIKPGNNQFVVIMTFGYRTDDIALRSLIELNFKYLGVLGSKSKMEQLFKEWERDGIPAERLKKIHAPLGIQIKSQTPEEIAISIAAEIIKIKNDQD